MKQLTKSILALTLTSALAATTALSQPFPGETLHVNENGLGLLTGPTLVGFINGSLGVDPISGMTTLCYPLQWPVIPGDVVLFEGTNSSQFSDLIRFVPDPTRNDLGNLYFFSELEPGEPNPELADVGLPPVNGTPIFLFEIGPEGNNSATYVPAPGLPGFDLSGTLPGLTYDFISDVPEPGSLSLLLAGAALAGLRILRRKHRAQQTART